MNCPECLERLQKRLDAVGLGGVGWIGNPAPEDPALERHLSECSACREQQAAAQRLLEGMKHLPVAKLPANFARDMAATIVRDRRHRREKLGRRVLVTMALAASVLLTLLGAYWWFPPERPDQPAPQPSLVENRPDPEPAPKGPRQEQAPIAPRKTEPTSALAALTNRVADTTRDHAQVVWVATNLDKVEALSGVNEIPMLDPSVREAGQEVSDGVRTVTRGTRRAFDFFARELPMPEIAEQKN